MTERASARALGWLAGRGVRWRRDHVEAALAAAEIPPAAADVFYTRLAGHAVTFVRGGPARIQLGPALEAAIAATSGQPKVIFASHTGNWEVALAGIAAHLPVVAIVKRQSQPWADRLATRRRSGAGVGLLPAEGSMRAALGALAHGKTLVSLGDQAPRRRRGAVPDTFLGRACWTDKSPATLAARAGCPLWVLAQHEDAECTHVELLGFFEPPQHAARAWIEASTRSATALLDAWVRAHPADWLWLHRRWKDVPR